MIRANGAYQGLCQLSIGLAALLFTYTSAEAAVIARVVKDKELILVNLEKGDRRKYELGEIISLKTDNEHTIDGTVSSKKGHQLVIAVDFGLEHAQRGLKVVIANESSDQERYASNDKKMPKSKKTEKLPQNDTEKDSTVENAESLESIDSPLQNRVRSKGFSPFKIYPSLSSHVNVGIGPEAVDLEKIDGHLSFLGGLTHATLSQKVNSSSNSNIKYTADLLNFQAGIMTHVNEKVSVLGSVTRRETTLKAKVSGANASITLKAKAIDQLGSLHVSYKLRNDIILGAALNHLEAEREQQLLDKKVDGKSNHNFIIPSVMYLSGKGETVIGWKAPYNLSNDGGLIADEGYFSIRHNYQLNPLQSVEAQIARLFWSAFDEDETDQFYIGLGSHYRSNDSIFGAGLGWTVQHNDGGENLDIDTDDRFHLVLDYKINLLKNGSFLGTQANYTFGSGSANEKDWDSKSYSLAATLNYVL